MNRQRTSNGTRRLAFAFSMAMLAGSAVAETHTVLANSVSFSPDAIEVAPGDTITCTATASDTDGGSDSSSASATVLNADPELDDVGEGETVTDSYQMLNTRLTKTYILDGSELKISVFGSNLLDEVARNHASFVKNEVPLPGRNYGIRFNLTF